MQMLRSGRVIEYIQLKYEDDRKASIDLRCNFGRCICFFFFFDKQKVHMLSERND